MNASGKRESASDAPSETEFSVTFVGMLPSEELTGHVRRFVRNRLKCAVHARLERSSHSGLYRVVLEHGRHKQSYEHRDAVAALCGAFDRFEVANAAHSGFRLGLPHFAIH